MSTNDLQTTTSQPESETPARGGFWPIRLKSLSKQQRLLVGVVSVAGLTIAAIAMLIWYLIFRQPITELPGLGITVPPRYAFSVSGIEKPLGVAVDAERNRIYVTQSAGDRAVLVFDLEGNPIGKLPQPDDKALHTPTYLAVDSGSGRLYVSDRTANNVYTYTAAGKYDGIIRPSGIEGWSPLALEVADDGTVYISESSQGRQVIWHLQADGEVIDQIGASDGLAFANGIAIRDNGELLVADSNNSRVVRFSAEGEFLGKLGRGEADSTLAMPRGLAVGSGGRLYIVDTVNAVIRVYRTDQGDEPEYATYFGEIGNVGGTFLFPNDVDADDNGRIYVTDRENNRLQVWVNR